MDESVLLKRLQAREYLALDRAIEIYTPYLSTVLYNVAGVALSKEDTEEIISDVFVTLWTHAKNIDLNKGTLRAYLAAVAKNTAYSKLRKNGEMIGLDEIELPVQEDFMQQYVEYSSLWSAVMSLGEPDNEIFVRYYKYNEKLKDIAKLMGLNLSTVKTKLLRGKRKLKLILQDKEELL